MEKTWRSKTAGILDIIAGAMGLCAGGLVLWLRGTLPSLDWWGKLPSHWGWWGPGIGRVHILRLLQDMGLLPTALLIAGIVFLVLGAITVTGGTYAIQRKRWGLALAGSILAIPQSGPLGVLAIIFVSLGKKEFK